MSVSSESAEQMTRMMLEGSEVVIKVTGKGAVELLALISSALNSKEQTKGKTRLNNMLKSGKELKIFSIKNEDLKMFAQEAKRYGVLYSVLVDKSNKNFDGMVDIMVRAEDSSKINRIVERFKLSTLDEAKVKADIIKDKNERKENDKGVEQKSEEEKLADELIKKPIFKEENEVQSPNITKTEKKPQSEHFSKTLNKSEGDTNMDKKKSVRQDLKEIKEQMEKDRLPKEKSQTKEFAPNVTNKATKSKDKVK